jgi:hypothetical protein
MRANEVLRRLAGPSVGAEIGVLIGQMSECLLNDRKCVMLYMVDSWADESHQPVDYKATGDWHATIPLATQNIHMETAKKVVEPFGDRAQIIRKRSIDAAKDFRDEFFDFVFIDADHSYIGCKSDIEAWRPKIKPGGWLCGHDYDFPGLPFGAEVKRAVDEAIAANGWTLELGDNYTWFARMP